MPVDSRGRTYFRKLFFKKVTSSRENFLLAEGDIALDEDDGKLYRGDGSTLGGILIGQASSLQLTDLSTATTSASGGGGLVYNNTTGQFTFTPADVSGGGSSLTVQDEGSALSTAATTLNFVGAGVTATGTGATKTITIAGGGGGGLNNIVEDTTPQLGGALDGQAFDITTTGKILYSNLYATEGDLPNATTYHGMFAHVHATGAGYFAHGGAWIKLANDSQLSSYQTTAGLNGAIDTHLNQSNPASGYVLSWNGSDYAWVSNAGGGGLSNIVEDTTPQLGGALDTNGNNITFADSVNAEFGADGDLKIFHNGSHSIVRETGTGSLYLQSDNNVILSTDSGTKKMIKGVGSGGVELYHNDVLKLNTSTSGVTVVDEVHTEGATPHLTLKRTDNANVPTIRFKGSGGTIGASIDFDGTAGTSNELAFQTYDGATIAERFRVTYTGAKVTGRIDIGGSLGIGQNAARTNQGIDAVAVGGIAGDDAQGDKAVAVGASAGQLDQGAGAVALGFGAGQNLQAANSIVINATGSVLQNTTASSTVIKPIRNASGTHALEYNPTTGEVTYDTLPAGGGSQNLFSTIASAGQNNIVADGTTDTLYIEAGTGISIATDQNTDTLTITATGAGAQTLDDVVTLGNSTNSAVTINNTLTVNSVQSTGVGFATMTSATDIILNPAGEVSVSNSKISNVSDPTQPTQAATKNYVDSYAVLLATLKTEVAASTSFADFQSRIASL